MRISDEPTQDRSEDVLDRAIGLVKARQSPADAMQRVIETAAAFESGDFPDSRGAPSHPGGMRDISSGSRSASGVGRPRPIFDPGGVAPIARCDPSRVEISSCRSEPPDALRDPGLIASNPPGSRGGTDVHYHFDFDPVLPDNLFDVEIGKK